MSDILFTLNKFDIKKSSGNSEIPNFVFQYCPHSISKFLFILFNEILKRNQIPDKLKINLITPLCKKGKDKKLFNFYRPASVSPNIYYMYYIKSNNF